jgi:hypothetical protein
LVLHGGADSQGLRWEVVVAVALALALVLVLCIAMTAAWRLRWQAQPAVTTYLAQQQAG